MLRLAVCCLGLGVAAPAHAQDREPAAQEVAPPASSAPSPPVTDAETTSPPELAAGAKPAAPVVPPKSPVRSQTLEPQVAVAKAPGRATFDVDPIADTGLIVISGGLAFVLEQINSTGEIRPQAIAPDFDKSHLIGIDRAAVEGIPDSGAGPRSNIGLFAAAAFAFADPVMSGFREDSVQTGLVDAMLYAESVGLTFAFTTSAKLAVRRPRPIAYRDAQEAFDAGQTEPYQSSSTDSGLSFFSGHASVTAAIGATATYLAFTRDPGGVRPWLTLGGATAVTTFVSVERVRAGKHFPTDVIAGVIAGAGIGIVVPHLHRTEDVKQRRVWVGFAPVDADDEGQGGLLSVSGVL
jgi:membrane-associated phospholipid phosphatase